MQKPEFKDHFQQFERIQELPIGYVFFQRYTYGKKRYNDDIITIEIYSKVGFKTWLNPPIFRFIDTLTNTIFYTKDEKIFNFAKDLIKKRRPRLITQQEKASDKFDALQQEIDSILEVQLSEITD